MAIRSVSGWLERLFRRSLMRAGDGERAELCEELEAIEKDLLRQPTNLYHKGTEFAASWEVVDGIRIFTRLEKNVCDGRGPSCVGG